MASFGHIAVGIAAARAYLPKDAPRGKLIKTALIFSALSMLPDADVIAFPLGIAYEHPLGHRGASHSFVFAVFVGLVALALARPLKQPPLRLFVTVTVILLTHGLLDTLTNGGLGIELLWPFSYERFFAPVSLIPVAPIGLGMLSVRGLLVIVVELVMFSPLVIYATFPRKRAEA